MLAGKTPPLSICDDTFLLLLIAFGMCLSPTFYFEGKRKVMYRFLSSVLQRHLKKKKKWHFWHIAAIQLLCILLREQA